MKRIRGLAIPLAVLALVAACNANSSDSGKKVTSSKKGGTLYVLTDSDRIDLDPAKSQNLGTTTIHLFERSLTTWKENASTPPKVVGDMATDAGKPSDGGKTWTYTLKDGLKYQDGKPITAQDVKYSVERSFAPELTGGLNYHKGLLVGGDTYKGPYNGKDLTSIETPNDKTIIFHLNKPFGDWPWIVSMPAFTAVPKSADSDPAHYGDHIVATGPYEVESLKQGEQLTAKRNPNWSHDSIRTGQPDKIVMEMISNDQTVNNRLISGQGNDANAISYVSLQAPLLPKVQRNPDVKERLVTGSGALEYLAMNMQHKTLQNLKVRQAIEYAVNKKAVQIAAGGSTVGGDVASTLITPGLNGYQKYNLYPASDEGNVKKAKQLLKDAGWDKNTTLSLLVPNDSASSALAEAVQAGLKRAGIKVKLHEEDANAATEDQTGKEGPYDLTISSWLADFPSAYGAIQPLFAGDQIGNGGYNMSRYDSPAVNSAISDAIGTTDATAAAQKWAAIDKQIMKDAPVVPLLYAKNAFLRGANVANFYLPPYPPYPNLLTLGVTK
ncbi:MAG TPA: ABC transporter substrate-binding protein [Mycobacteriales bacterium]|nr:ABC transporter substrate-binding protein [Mycobacteriales bacterium]